MKGLILIICLLLAALAQDNNPLTPTSPAQEVVMAVGQIFPGQINYQESKQAIHYLKV